MAKKANRPAGSWPFVLKGDRELPEAEQTRFVLRPLTHEERAAARDDIGRISTDRDGGQTFLSRQQRLGVGIVLDAIVSIDNFPVGEAKPWPADRAARKEYLEMLHDEDVQEIANAVWYQSTTDDVAKNS